MINVSDNDNMADLSQSFITGEKRVKRFGIKGIVSLLFDMRKGFRKTIHLLPIYILMLMWIIFSLIASFGVKSMFTDILCLLTFSEGGMTGGFLGITGGIIGKVIYAYFIMSILLPVYSKQKTYKGIIHGAGTFVHSFVFYDLKSVSSAIAGLGFAFVTYNMLTGNNSWINSFISPAIFILTIRAMGNRYGGLWDAVSAMTKKDHGSTVKIMAGYALGILLAVPCFLFGSAFICYIIGLTLIVISVLLIMTGFFIRRKKRTGISGVILILLCMSVLMNPLNVHAAVTREIEGIWILEDIDLIDPDTNENPNEYTEVADGYFHKHYAVDSHYDTQYWWSTLPEKIYAGHETDTMIAQKMVYSGDTDMTQSVYLKATMYISYTLPDTGETQANYFQSSPDFTQINISGEYESENTVFFMSMTGYYDLYDKLDKNNCKLVIEMHASFGGRVDYIYGFQENDADRFFTWLVGNGSYEDHLSPLNTLFSDLMAVLFSLMCVAISLGSVSLRKKKTTAKSGAEARKEKPDIIVPVEENIPFEEDMFSDALMDLQDRLYSGLSVSWVKYREILMKTLGRSKEHTMQYRNILAMEASAVKFRNSIIGLGSGLASFGYNNDCFASAIRGDEIAMILGKAIYANYIFNSIASDTPYLAFLETCDAFALEGMKAGSIASSAANMKGIAGIGLEGLKDPESAFKSAEKGRYGETIRKMVKSQELTLDDIKGFSNTDITAEQIDGLYTKIMSGTLDDEDVKVLQKYKIYSTKSALKYSQLQYTSYENTSLVVKSFFDW